MQGRLIRADLILTWKILEGECAVEPTRLFLLDESRRRGHSRKLFLPRCAREVRRRFFPVRVVKLWNSLSETTVTSDSLAKFKQSLHRDLGQQSAALRLY